MESKQCVCGKTKKADGTCDGSHNSKTNGVEKSIPFDKITIRVISTGEPQKTKHLYFHVANNKRLMRNMGFSISDPHYEAKMKAFNEKKPYVETASKKSVE